MRKNLEHRKGPERQRCRRGRDRHTGREREKGRMKPGRRPSHVLMHRKGFKGQIPLQHTLVHVGQGARPAHDFLAVAAAGPWIG